MANYELCILNTLKYPTGTASQEVKELGGKQSELFKRHFQFINFLFYCTNNRNHINIWLRLAQMVPQYSSFLAFCYCLIWQKEKHWGGCLKTGLWGNMHIFGILCSNFEGRFLASPGFAWFLSFMAGSICQKC